MASRPGKPRKTADGRADSAGRELGLPGARRPSRVPAALGEAHRAHGVTRGQWYFLRVLWTEDGLSQRELPRASA